MEGARRRLVLVAVILSGILIPINSSMIAVGLEPIAHGLRLPTDDVVWAVTIYLVVMAAMQPVAGKMGDLFGRRRLLLLGLGIFLLSSVGAAVFPHLLTLIIFRSGQALGGALMVPNGMGIIRSIYDGERLRRVLGVVGMMQSLGAAVGPLLGALLVSLGGWPLIFWVNVPIVGFALAAALLAVPRDLPTVRRPIDALGAFSLAVGLSFLALAMPRSGAHEMLWAIPFSLLGFGLFALVERRAPEPVVRFPLFRLRPFTSGNLAILGSNFFMYSTLLYMPIALKARGTGTGRIGLLMFLFSFVMSLSGWLGSRVIQRTGSRALVRFAFGVDLIVVIWYIGLQTSSPMAYIVAGLIIAGIGAGGGNVAMQATVLEAVPPAIAGVSSGIYSTFRYIGSITASALIGIMVASHGAHWGILAGVGLLGTMVAQGFPTRSQSAGLSQKVAEG